jgi:hypothetical protein
MAVKSKKMAQEILKHRPPKEKALHQDAVLTAAL